MIASIYAIFQTASVSIAFGLAIATWPIYKVIMNGIYNMNDNDETWNEYYVAR